MNKSFEKILERLEKAYINCFTTGDYKFNNAIDKSKQIVQEVAEEYNITNGDKIRSMSDEELAEFLCKVKADYQWVDHEFPSEEECGEWEEWLKSESE